MRRELFIALVGAVIAMSLTLSGCRWAKEKMGIAEEVTSPEAGTPEKVVYDVIKAAIMFRQGKKADGWKLFEKQLHPDEKAPNNPVRGGHWKTGNFLNTVKKVHLFTTASDDKGSVKDSDPTYAIARRDESDDGKRLKIYVVNEGNEESPTPCKMELTDDGWKIRDTCL